MRDADVSRIRNNLIRTGSCWALGGYDGGVANSSARCPKKRSYRVSSCLEAHSLKAFSQRDAG